MEFALGIGLRREPAFVKVAKVELAQRLHLLLLLRLYSFPFSARINSCSMGMEMWMWMWMWMYVDENGNVACALIFRNKPQPIPLFA